MNVSAIEREETSPKQPQTSRKWLESAEQKSVRNKEVSEAYQVVINDYVHQVPLDKPKQ